MSQESGDSAAAASPTARTLELMRVNSEIIELLKREIPDISVREAVTLFFVLLGKTLEMKVIMALPPEDREFIFREELRIHIEAWVRAHRDIWEKGMVGGLSAVRKHDA
jgi:hypothetical protein